MQEKLENIFFPLSICYEILPLTILPGLCMYNFASILKEKNIRSEDVRAPIEIQKHVLIKIDLYYSHCPPTGH